MRDEGDERQELRVALVELVASDIVSESVLAASRGRAERGKEEKARRRVEREDSGRAEECKHSRQTRHEKR